MDLVQVAKWVHLLAEYPCGCPAMGLIQSLDDASATIVECAFCGSSWLEEDE